MARLEIAGERSAGAVQLLDKRWRRRTVGVVSGSAADRSQPLIGATYYIQRALNPFADVRLAEGVAPAEAVKRFLDQHLPMLILADVGNVAEARDRLDKWIDNGGVLVRFAGPHLAGADDDDLVPVKLRRGGRIFGGSLSWEKPQPLAVFRAKAHSPAWRYPTTSPSAARCWPNRTRSSATAPGRRSPTARRWSPPNVSAKDCWYCST